MNGPVVQHSRPNGHPSPRAGLRAMAELERSVVDHPDRSLLLIWPTKNETWAAEALVNYHEPGGTCVRYVGDGPGGRDGRSDVRARACRTLRALAVLGQLWRWDAEVTLPGLAGRRRAFVRPTTGSSSSRHRFGLVARRRGPPG